MSAKRKRLALLLALALAGCGDRAKLDVAQGMGPAPVLPPPVRTPIPTIKVAEATGWPAGAHPIAAPGLKVAAFAQGLDHPRWLAVLPNGDVLVAETNAPARPKDNRGIKGYFFKMFQKKAGGGVPSANRITLLRDGDGDGVAESRSVLLSGINSPFGIDLAGGTLYVAATDAILAYPYRVGDTMITAKPRKLLDLPGGRATITGPRMWWSRPTARGSMSPSARTAMSPSTVSPRRRGGRRSG
jgi:glucose/arabinose dehydrogenase